MSRQGVGSARTKLASNNKKKRRTKKDDDVDEEVIKKKEVFAYKYSKKGLGFLHEAIILQGEPCFVCWYGDNGPNTESIKIVPFIEEATRIIRPPTSEAYPYTPYDFADEEELRDYFSRANTIESRGELYSTAKSHFEKYIDQDNNIIIILAADSIFTHFQDLFPITHYCEGIGGNDVGKSSIGYTFEYTGYRVIRGTSISGANYSRILGNVEQGQCTIIEDEADSISDDPEKVKILKSGYEHKTKTPKTNMNTKNQETNWFYPYCYKIILAEKSMSEWKAKGLVDRTFSFKCRPGRVRYSIKKVVSDTIHKSPELQRLYDELLDFRKLMLCYRLIHYDDELPEIKVSIINRDEELSYPLLQLFYGTEAFEEIKTAVEFFLSQRRQRRSRSLESALYPILKDLINAQSESNVVNILYSTIWNKITTEHTIKGNLFSDTLYETLEYGPVYHNTLSKLIGDKFSAIMKHGENGSILTFDKGKFSSYDEIYNHQAEDSEIDLNIEVKLVNLDPEGTEGTEGTDGFSGCVDNNNEHENHDKKDITHPPEPSEPSEPSAKTSGFIKCPECKFKNINQETVDHHLRLTHG